MRSDFARLTPEALAALANWGLVKRAQREAAPALAEDSGVWRATYADGIVCTFPAARPASEGSCSCPAVGWCRHLVGALLACARPVEEVDYRVQPEEVCALLNGRLLKQAASLRARGLTVEVAGPPWQVRLPGCTVRFLVGGAAGYCKCDCEATGPCAHWALAAWAVHQLGKAGTLVWQPQHRPSELVCCRAWLDELLEAGCEQCQAVWKVWGARVRREMEGLCWLQVLVEELLELGRAYDEAAASYDSGRWLFCLLSLLARLRTGGHLLGGDLLWEQELEHTRLLCLGARLRGPGVEFYWADEGGQVLLQRFGGASHPLGSLQEVARSQLVSRGVVRRADGTLRLRRSRQLHSLAPLSLDWKSFPPALIWPGSIEGESSLLRPPLAGQDFWVVPLAWAEPVGYDAGSQTLVADVGDLCGGVLRLRRTHQRECPDALDALARHLDGAVWLSGRVSSQRGQLVVEPVALGKEAELVVLDLESGSPTFTWPLTLETGGSDGLTRLLDESLQLCRQAAQLGLAQLLPSFHKQREELGERLQEAALPNLKRVLSQEWSVENFWGAALRCWLAAERRSVCSP